MTAWSIVALVLTGVVLFAAGVVVGQRRWPADRPPGPVKTRAEVERSEWRVLIGLWLMAWAVVGLAIAFSVAPWPLLWAGFIWPAGLATVLGFGGLWLSRRS